MSWHLGFNIATGAYFIYTLFHTVGEDDVNNCIIDNIDNIFKSVQCMRAFEFVRGLIIGILIAFWLFELCAYRFILLPLGCPNLFPIGG
jgi:hypothetical protein